MFTFSHRLPTSLSPVYSLIKYQQILVKQLIPVGLTDSFLTKEISCYATVIYSRNCFVATVINVRILKLRIIAGNF